MSASGVGAVGGIGRSRWFLVVCACEEREKRLADQGASRAPFGRDDARARSTLMRREANDGNVSCERPQCAGRGDRFLEETPRKRENGSVPASAGHGTSIGTTHVTPHIPEPTAPNRNREHGGYRGGRRIGRYHGLRKTEISSALAKKNTLRPDQWEYQ